MQAIPHRLIDVRADHHHWPYHNQNMTHTLTKEVRKLLVVDKPKDDIGACLETPQGTPSYLKGEYLILKWWYWHVSFWHPKFSCTDLEKSSGDYALQYQKEYPPPPLSGPYELTSPLLTFMIKQPPRDILRRRLEFWRGIGQAVIPTFMHKIYRYV